VRAIPFRFYVESLLLVFHSYECSVNCLVDVEIEDASSSLYLAFLLLKLEEFK